jgi:YfiH family protein
MKQHYIFPNWPAPKNVKAVVTTRKFGYSASPYNEFNLADHVNDDVVAVEANRRLLSTELQLSSGPCWLNQTHSSKFAYLTAHSSTPIAADASFTDKKDIVCSVLTADCLPILLSNKTGTIVAAIHAGWRGLLNGIVEATCLGMKASGDDLIAWLGPAIGPDHFLVRNDVYDFFLKKNSNFENSFKIVHNNQWLANIYGLAREILQNLGIREIYGGEFCTYAEKDTFFSYRRDGDRTGRMACLIWLI